MPTDRRGDGGTTPASAAMASGAAEDLRLLAAFGEAAGPSLDETLRLFAGLRARPEEARAIALLLALDARTPLPEALLVAVASALVDRGEGATAARVLARGTSTAALMLRADVLATAAESAGPAGAGSDWAGAAPAGAAAGDLATAIALVERVLLRDFDWPGARERHARWRRALGVAEPARSPSAQGDAAATLVTSEPDAPFRLLREVDRGGAGAVYEAEDRALGRRVALKVYHRRYERDRAQLLHEARVAVALSGPGIVRVFDVDAEQGWLAMEWVRLGTFRAFLRTRGAALRPLRRWALPLARALARVHARGWVHHDVKPANILLGGASGEPDAPLLSDFGTARRIGEASPPGSLGYVSPERLALGSRRPSTPRDDVYGFGRVLEEALDAVGPGAPPPRDDAPWRILAAACTAPDEARLDSGDSLAKAMEGLPAG